jgi:hypothetical protein
MALLASLSACVTGVDRVATDFAPSNTEGLVYGRMELLVNDGAVEPDKEHGQVMAFLRKFTGIDDLYKPVLGEAPGTLRIEARVSNRGDFVAKLPVGHYYFDHFVYLSFMGRRGNADWCTYSGTGYTTVSTPMLVTFDVLPNTATYIGTIRHLIRVDNPYSPLGTRFKFALDMKNEFTSSTNRVLAPYTKIQRSPEVNLALVQVLMAPVDFKRPERPAAKRY